jgi:hypothetical protein
MPNAVPVYTPQRTGFQRSNGERVDTEAAPIFGLQTFAAGTTVGPVFDCGGRQIARAHCKVVAKSGTNPTLDVTIQSSPNGKDDWQSVGTFAQKTDAAAEPYGGLVMGAVGSSGTTPPTITLTGTQVVPVDLKIICTTLGARGTAIISYSIDGGVTYVAGVVTAATIAVIDPNGTDTGLVINYANAAAAVDNVWTAKTVGFERKRFTGLGRYLRGIALVGGSSTPTMTGEVSSSSSDPCPSSTAPIAELGQFGISPEVTADPDAPIDSAVLDGILQACSAQADGYLQSSGRITLPLTAWGVDLKMCVAKLAAWEIMAVRVGHNPDDPNNFVWRDRRDEA